MRKDEATLFFDQRLSSSWNLSAVMRKTQSASETREHRTTVGAVPDDAGNINRTIYTADRKTDIFAADLRLSGIFSLGPTRHTFAGGIDYQDAFWEEYNYSYVSTGGGLFNVYNPVYGFVNTSVLAFSDQPDNQIVQTGLYLTDHMEWGSWVLSGAVRRDSATNEVLNVGAPDTEVENTATTGRLGLMYRFDNGLSPYVSASTSFTPNLGTDGTSASSYLELTTGEQIEAGIKYLSNSGNTSATLAWFDIEQKNRVVDGSTPGGVEQVGAQITGWELDVRHRMGRLELSGNFTALDAANDATEKRLSAIPEVSASA